MARASLCLFAVVAMVLLTLTAAADQYDDSRWEHINVDEILGNPRILGSFIKCFLDQGPCTADARDMKKLLPEAIESNCGKCTNKQKKLMAKAIKYVIENRSKDWELLEKKYDPESKHKGEIDQFLKDVEKLR